MPGTRAGVRAVSALDEVLPPHVIGELRAQVIELQARPPRPGDARTHWYLLAAPARSLFEQVIQHLRGFVPRAHELVGAEWWVRAAPTDTGFPFHFDRDEGIRTRIVSPTLASILYLGNAGGPTVIVGAAPSRRTAPDAAIAVSPRPGRFCMFPGPLLHGVLPGRPGRWPRVTLLVNWWRAVPRMERAPDHVDRRPASGRWRGGAHRATPAPAALASIDPSRLLARAAWRDLIAEQLRHR